MNTEGSGSDDQADDGNLFSFRQNSNFLAQFAINIMFRNQGR